MDGSQIPLILGFAILLGVVMYMAAKLEKLRRRARHLKHLVRKLEGKDENEEEIKKLMEENEQMGS